MENMAKALQIAGGVLLAVIILALVVYSFRQFGILPQQQDESMTAEQLAKFNKEYEVYNKSEMYGVDVISCLNKVQNYNEKYILEAGKQLKGDGFYVGTNKHGNEFRIDIGLRIAKPLEERLVVHRIDEKTGKSVELYSDPGVGREGHVTDDRPFNTIFKLDDDYKYTNYCGKNFDVVANGMKSNEVSGSNKMDANTIYKLYDNNGKLKELITFKKDLKLIIKNDGKVKPVTDWSDATWYTALYDLKTRRFRCDYVRYNQQTGQINGIYFSEVDLSSIPATSWD